MNGTLQSWAIVTTSPQLNSAEKIVRQVEKTLKQKFWTNHKIGNILENAERMLL